LNSILERIKRFLHLHRTKNRNKPLEQSSIIVRLAETPPTISVTETPPTPDKHIRVFSERVIPTEKWQSFQPSVNFVKLRQQERVRAANVERQKSTMGYGLKSRNFRPRPASEKQLFDLRKKPEEDN